MLHFLTSSHPTGEELAAVATVESGPTRWWAARHTLIVTMGKRGRPQRAEHRMMRIMVQAWDRASTTIPDIRCCILTGAGGYFCAGMDLKAAARATPSGRQLRPVAHRCPTQGRQPTKCR